LNQILLLLFQEAVNFVVKRAVLISSWVFG